MKQKQSLSHDEFLLNLKNNNRDFKNNRFSIVSTYVNSFTKILCHCNKCKNDWYAAPYNLYSNKSCPNCHFSSKGEAKIYDYLINNKIEYEGQKSFEELIGEGGKLLLFDFFLPVHNILIEFQGIQHYEPTTFGGISIEEAISNFEKQQIHDNLKRDYAITNNIKLIEIPYFNYDSIETILNNLVNESEE